MGKVVRRSSHAIWWLELIIAGTCEGKVDIFKVKGRKVDFEVFVKVGWNFFGVKIVNAGSCVGKVNILGEGDVVIPRAGRRGDVGNAASGRKTRDLKAAATPRPTG
jgi:hypothetical protein